MGKRVPRTRNLNTETESMFWTGIRSALRQKSRWWKPAQQAKKNARRPYNGKGRQKWEYQCASCKGWFKEKEIHIDHIVEVGSLRCGDDLKGFVERLFCEDVNGYQILCKDKCHHKKTHKK